MVFHSRSGGVFQVFHEALSLFLLSGDLKAGIAVPTVKSRDQHSVWHVFRDTSKVELVIKDRGLTTLRTGVYPECEGENVVHVALPRCFLDSCCCLHSWVARWLPGSLVSAQPTLTLPFLPFPSPSGFLASLSTIQTSPT